jgi:hypothetical protein
MPSLSRIARSRSLLDPAQEGRTTRSQTTHSTLTPQVGGNWQRIDALSFPPVLLLAGLMKLAVMQAAKWHGKMIAYLPSQGGKLRNGIVSGQVSTVVRVQDALETVKLVNGKTKPIQPKSREFQKGR